MAAMRLRASVPPTLRALLTDFTTQAETYSVHVWDSQGRPLIGDLVINAQR